MLYFALMFLIVGLIAGALSVLGAAAIAIQALKIDATQSRYRTGGRNEDEEMVCGSHAAE